MTDNTLHIANPFAAKPKHKVQSNPQHVGMSQFYDSEIKCLETEFETARKAAVKIFWFRLPVSVLLIAAALVLFAVLVRAEYIILESNNRLMMLSVAFAAVVAVGAWTKDALNCYHNSVKDTILPKVFNFFGESFQYSRHSQLKIRDLVGSEIVPSHTFAPTEDYVTGSYKGVGIELMETKLIKEVHLGKARYPKEIFRGFVIRLVMNKSFNSHTIVERDSGAIRNWFKKVRSRSRFQRVRLEDPIFEKRFEVYSDDQVDARYLLSPSFMDRLTKLQDAFNGSAIKASFYENSLLLMVASKTNRFEPKSAFKALDLKDDAERTLAEMQEVLNIVDVLKLNQSTGL